MQAITDKGFYTKEVIQKQVERALILVKDKPLHQRDPIVKWRKEILSLIREHREDERNKVPMHIQTPLGEFSYQLDLLTILEKIIALGESKSKLSIDVLKHHVSTVKQLPLEAEEDPIVLIETPLLTRGYLLFGHYEILHAEVKKQKNVNVIVLMEEDLWELLHDPLSKAMYGLHRDTQDAFQFGRSNDRFLKRWHAEKEKERG